MNNPLKYTDPSGNEVDIGGENIQDLDFWNTTDPYWFMANFTKMVNHAVNHTGVFSEPDLLAAYAKLSIAAPELTSGLENSSNVFNLQWTKSDSGSTNYIDTLGEKEIYNVDIPDSFKNDPSGVAVLLAHESVHMARFDKFGSNSKNSYYEEAIASHFEGYIADKIFYRSFIPPFVCKWHAFWLIDVNVGLASLVPFGRKSGDSILNAALGVYMMGRDNYKIDHFPIDSVFNWLQANFNL